MNLDKNTLKDRLSTPAAALAMGLSVAVVLVLLPTRATDALRDAVAGALRPGQSAASHLREHGSRATSRLKSHFRTASRLTETERELQRLRHENRELAAALAAARRSTGPAEQAEDDESDTLLRARCVAAQVLGRQARTFLGRRGLLDVGSEAHIDPDALVVDLPPLIDRGNDAELADGQLILADRHIWGKIAQTGRNTSTVQTLTEPGYRDLVALGTLDGPQGILEGTGEPLPRIRLVEVTEPVSLGDPVYTVAGKGVFPTPLLYGRIVQLERPVGAAHWEIRMQPAVAEEPDRVAVVRTELNPVRVAEKPRAGQKGIR
ncbi:MAG: rod shape-determining protein MreC [Thermoguttaceae bacterium]